MRAARAEARQWRGTAATRTRLAGGALVLSLDPDRSLKPRPLSLDPSPSTLAPTQEGSAAAGGGRGGGAARRAHRDRKGPLLTTPAAATRSHQRDLARSRRISRSQARHALDVDFDGWGGYPAERERLLRLLGEAAKGGGALPVVYGGDSHNAWAGRVRDGGGALVAVEFDGTSVRSPPDLPQVAVPRPRQRPPRPSAKPSAASLHLSAHRP